MTANHTKLYHALLDHIATQGLSEEGFEMVSAQAGYNAAYVWTIYDDIEDFCSTAITHINNELSKHAASDDLQAMKIRERIHYLVKTRLDITKKHKDAFKAIYRYMMQPTRSCLTADIAWKTSDLIWRLAGDKSYDYNFYTKRILLLPVLASTTMYWMNDHSKNNEDSWQFLTRRIDNVLALGIFKRSATESLKKFFA